MRLTFHPIPRLRSLRADVRLTLHPSCVFHDRSFTAPDQPSIAYPPGFQGNEIPIDADVVVAIVKARLNNDEEAHDG